MARELLYFSSLYIHHVPVVLRREGTRHLSAGPVAALDGQPALCPGVIRPPGVGGTLRVVRPPRVVGTLGVVRTPVPGGPEGPGWCA